MRRAVYNILVTPLVLVRAPLIIAAMTLLWLGGLLDAAGREVPGWRP